MSFPQRQPDSPNPAPHQNSSRLMEVATYFLRLGFTSFGGPAAHIALMEQDLVVRRQWLDRRHFLDLVSAIHFIPGPNSTQLAIHLGYLRAGWRGLFVAGICFIFPAVLIILPIAWAYSVFGQKPDARGILTGVNAAVLAIVIAALVRFAKTAIKDRLSAALTVLAALAAIWTHRVHLPAGDLAVLAFTAVAGAIGNYRANAVNTVKRSGGTGNKGSEFPDDVLPAISPGLGLFHLAKPVAGLLSVAAAAPALAVGILVMALLFLKIGATIFGSGYVLLSYLQNSFVDSRGWLTPRQLLDAVAVGQFTPGPLLTTATFVGFILGYGRFGGGLPGGIAGAIVATVAIFLPSFVFIALLGPVLPRIRNHPIARGALDGMNAGVVALIAVTALFLAHDAVTGFSTAAIAVGSLVAILFLDLNATWPLLAAAAIGWICQRAQL